MNPLICGALSCLLEALPNTLRAIKRQKDVWQGRKPDSQPILLSATPAQTEDFPSYSAKEIHFDTEKMLLSGFKEMLSAIAGQRDAVPSLRANMGCGIIPTLFGVKQELFDDKMPWVVKHLDKKTLSEMTPEDLNPGEEFKAAISHMQAAAELLKNGEGYVFPLDIQGAFDTAHIVYGDDIFYDLYDDPEFVHHLLRLSVAAVKYGLDECLRVIPFSDKIVTHYNSLAIPRQQGGVKLSEDTSTLLSREQLAEFVVPYMRELLSYYGGGYIHYCGKNDHLFEAVMNEPLVRGINFGNNEKHDMGAVLSRCASEDKIYYGAVNRLPGEENIAYFERVLRASKTADGRFNLLLTCHCETARLDTLISDWERAQQTVDSER